MSDMPVLQAVREEAWSFEFHQAVRLLELGLPAGARVGGSARPQDEAVHFRSWLSLCHPTSGLVAVRAPLQDCPWHGPDHEVAASGAVGRLGSGGTVAECGCKAHELTVSFLGLYGTAGALPTAYTEMLLDLGRDHPVRPPHGRKGVRGRPQIEALRAFLDIFNHRFISLFHRAHEKYRPAAALRPDGSDRVSRALYTLMGVGEDADRAPVGLLERSRLLRYCGLFILRPRSLAALQSLVQDFLGSLPATVLQFVANWVAVEELDQGRLSRGHVGNALGQTIVVGSRARDRATKFRVCVGPIGLEAYLAHQPDAPAFADLSALVREYVGDNLAFDLQFTVRAAEVPALHLSKTSWPAMKLGRTTWLGARPRSTDAPDPVFRPSRLEAQPSFPS